jgi:hypothetical protein
MSRNMHNDGQPRGGFLNGPTKNGKCPISTHRYLHPCTSAFAQYLLHDVSPVSLLAGQPSASSIIFAVFPALK